MNAKTISILTIFSFILNISIVIAIGYLGYKIIDTKTYLPMNCMATFHINMDSNNDIKGNVKVVYHITRNGLVVVNEYGELQYKDNEYIVDRTINMHMSSITENDFYKVTKDEVITNRQDNAPITLVQKLISNQPVYYYKIQKIDDDTWRISDLQRTIFLCGK